MAYTKQFLAAFFLLVGLPNGYSPSRTGRTSPYQGDTLLIEPQPSSGQTADGDILMDCDWPDDDVHDPRFGRADCGRN